MSCNLGLCRLYHGCLLLLMGPCHPYPLLVYPPLPPAVCLCLLLLCCVCFQTRLVCTCTKYAASSSSFSRELTVDCCTALRLSPFLLLLLLLCRVRFQTRLVCTCTTACLTCWRLMS
jgi:hypothetical protein